MVDFGNKLKELRKQKHLTQEQLAITLGITKSVVSAYELSLKYPSYDILINIAYTFHVSTDYLLGVKRDQSVDVTGLSREEVSTIVKLIELLRENKK